MCEPTYYHACSTDKHGHEGMTASSQDRNIGGSAKNKIDSAYRIGGRDIQNERAAHTRTFLCSLLRSPSSHEQHKSQTSKRRETQADSTLSLTHTHTCARIHTHVLVRLRLLSQTTRRVPDTCMLRNSACDLVHDSLNCLMILDTCHRSPSKSNIQASALEVCPRIRAAPFDLELALVHLRAGVLCTHA